MPAGNEPAGYAVLTERPFTQGGEDGWSTSSSSNFSFVDDATAPESPSKVGRILFPQGFLDGSSPAFTTRETFSQRRNVYMSTWMKVSANFEGHPVYSKMGYVWTGDKPKLMWGLVGTGANPLSIQFRLQNMNVSAQPNNNLANNVGSGSFSRDSWHHIELVAKTNTLDQANGELHAWLDGTKIAEYTNLNYNGSITWPTTRNYWHIAAWRPVWGGQCSPTRCSVAADMYMYMDHFYLSGAN